MTSFFICRRFRGSGVATRSRTMLLRCAGAVSGAVDVGDVATVGELVVCLAKRCACDAGELKVIAGGRLLPASETTTLESLGFSATTRLVVSRVRRDPAIEAQAKKEALEQARADRLGRIEKAAETLANRAGGHGHRFELEDQDGDGLAGVGENDRKALVTGLTLHQKGRLLLDGGDFADALGVMELAEEAFAVADPALTANLDNVPILHLDAAWAQFREFRRVTSDQRNQQTSAAETAETLAAGARRLRLCREGFARAHGPNLERLRAVHGGCAPELGLYVRLELLEGVLFLRAGDFVAARGKLVAARDKRDTLTRVVRPEAIGALLSMGIDTSEATRALRFCDGNVAAAAAHVMDARAKAETAAKAAAVRRETERAARRFGRTAKGALVDLNALASMESMGFLRALAAEALRATENNSQSALDALAFDRDGMEMAAAAAAAAAERADARREARKRRRVSADVEEADDGEDGDEDVSDMHTRLSDENVDPHTALVGMGFDSEMAQAALDAAGGDAIAAAEALTLAGEDSETGSETGSGSDESDESETSDAAADDDNTERDLVEAGKMCDDPLSAYDVDVTEAGAAIDEFLAMIPNQDEK